MLAAPLRLALVTPHYLPAIRGNSITVKRIAAGQSERGTAVEVFALDRTTAEQALRGLRAFRPEVVHGFHATASGPLILEAGRALGIPTVVTLTGTDVNQDLDDPARGPRVRQVLEEAQAVVVFHEVIRRRVASRLPHVATKLHVIGQAVRCLAGEFDLRGCLGLGPEAVVFLQAAGIRRVKNIPSIIPALTTLQARHPHLRYVLAGPILEPEEGARVQDLLRRLPWAAYLGEVAHQGLCAMLGAVDVAINSSLSEGGMSNAVLEAMSTGVPALAADIEGNRTIVTDGEDGFLFASEAEFLDKAERLITDPALRARLGRQARQKIGTRYSPEAETDAHLRLYRSLLQGGC